MKPLIAISQEYEAIKEKSFELSEKYHSQNDVYDLIKAIDAGKPPEYKRLEDEGKQKISVFIKAADDYCEDTKMELRELVNEMINLIIKGEEESINIFLLINYMWANKEGENNYDLEGIKKILYYLLKPELLDSVSIYYLESFIDIWVWDSDELVPIDILESIILKEQKGEYEYGALIKASSYLDDHSEEAVLRVIEKVKKSKRYKEDDYFREWID